MTAVVKKNLFQSQIKGKETTTINAHDLNIFVNKYLKEKYLFCFKKILPPEIYLIRILADKYKDTPKWTSLSTEDKATLLKMFEMNMSERGEHLRLRDKILDSMKIYFNIKIGYLSFKEIF